MKNKNYKFGNRKDYRSNAFTYWALIKLTFQDDYFNISTSDSAQVFGSLKQIVNITGFQNLLLQISSWKLKNGVNVFAEG